MNNIYKEHLIILGILAVVIHVRIAIVVLKEYNSNYTSATIGGYLSNPIAVPFNSLCSPQYFGQKAIQNY